MAPDAGQARLVHRRPQEVPVHSRSVVHQEHGRFMGGYMIARHVDLYTEHPQQSLKYLQGQNKTQHSVTESDILTKQEQVLKRFSSQVFGRRCLKLLKEIVHV